MLIGFIREFLTSKGSFLNNDYQVLPHNFKQMQLREFPERILHCMSRRYSSFLIKPDPHDEHLLLCNRVLPGRLTYIVYIEGVSSLNHAERAENIQGLKRIVVTQAGG